MSATSRRAVLQLYRDLLRYGRKLEFTDKEYYFLRIRHKFQVSSRSRMIQNSMILQYAYFQANKDLQDPQDITREIKVSDHRVYIQKPHYINPLILIRRSDISS